jgi:C4-dicarboxylate transporter DctM subunit
MTAITIGLICIIALIAFIYSGLHLAVALLGVSFLGTIALRGFDQANSLMAISATGSIATYEFAVVPLFVLMGQFVLVADMGRDIYQVVNQLTRRLPGGLGIGTVIANAIFAAVTGVTIASVTVFTQIAVPEMRRHGYSPRFAVGVVAGSSLLGMLIPPSALFILYGILTEQSIGALFIAGIIPGLILAGAYIVLIIGWALWKPEAFGNTVERAAKAPKAELLPWWRLITLSAPILSLVAIVLGGLYNGYFTALEAGAVGATGAFLMALLRGKLTLANLWDTLSSTALVMASIMLLIIGATMFSRLLALTGIPDLLATSIIALDVPMTVHVLIYAVVILILGTILDSLSIVLILVPVVAPAFQAVGIDLIWLGVITVIAVEVGLLTPPFGMAVFTIASMMRGDREVSLGDVFIGTSPFVVAAWAVTMLLVFFPSLSTMLVY